MLLQLQEFQLDSTVCEHLVLNIMFLFSLFCSFWHVFSPLCSPGGQMEGDGAGCLSCMTEYNGGFFSSLSPVCPVRQS